MRGGGWGGGCWEEGGPAESGAEGRVVTQRISQVQTATCLELNDGSFGQVAVCIWR